MRQHLDLDGDLAGGWRDALADPDRDPWGDVFPGAERGAAGRRIALTPGVQGSGRRPGGARAQPEPIEAEAAAQAVEHSGAAARKASGRRGELEPLSGGDLTDALAEQHAREDLVLRHDRRRGQRHRRRRGKTADIYLSGDVGGGRLGDDVEGRVELVATVKGDPAAGQGEGLAKEIDAAADLL